jgi:hypothetical protein
MAQKNADPRAGVFSKKLVRSTGFFTAFCACFRVTLLLGHECLVIGVCGDLVHVDGQAVVGTI